MAVTSIGHVYGCTDFYVSPPPSVVWPEAYCFCPVRPCVCTCVHVCVHPETLLTRYLAEYSFHIFTKLTSAIHYGTEINALNFGGQKVKVQGHGGITYAGTVTA